MTPSECDKYLNLTNAELRQKWLDLYEVLFVTFSKDKPEYFGALTERFEYVEQLIKERGIDISDLQKEMRLKYNIPIDNGDRVR